MIENKELAYEPLIYNGRRRCPHCTGFSRLTHTLLDSRSGNTVHVYQCIACGRRIWDESRKMRARVQ